MCVFAQPWYLMKAMNACTEENKRENRASDALSKKYENEEVFVRSLQSQGACFFIPRASLAPEPLQCLQVTTLSCTSACPYTPRAALAPEPLQYLQLASARCEEEKARNKSEAKTKKKRSL